MLPIEEWFRKPINRTEKKVNVNARSHAAAVHEVKPSAVKTAKPIETKEPLPDESIQDIQQIKVIQDTEEIRPRENEENIVTEESEDEVLTKDVTDQIGSDVKDMLDMGKEDILLAQIDEFREKAKQLQKLMSARENRAKDLESKVYAKQQQEKELDKVILHRQQEADRIMGQVSNWMDDMADALKSDVKAMTDPLMDKMDRMASSTASKMDNLSGEVTDKLDRMSGSLNTKMDDMSGSLNRQMSDINVNVTSNVEEMSQTLTRDLQNLSETVSRELSQSGENTKQVMEEATKTMIDQNTKSLEGLKEQLDQLTSMKSDLSEKIHTEDVKCFRNIRATMDEQSKTQLEEDEKKHKQVQERFEILENRVALQSKHMRLLVGITIVNFIGIIGILILEMGLF